MDKQVTIEDCMLSRLKNLLFRANLLTLKSKKTIILYRSIIEESDDIIEEEIATLSSSFVVVQVIIYGGCLVPNIQQQIVMDINEFPDWVMNRGKEIFQKIVENLESK
ncbi:MAG: hypothetical protein QW416_07035 [Candidatus Nitrosocaldaceae archaeon]